MRFTARRRPTLQILLTVVNVGLEWPIRDLGWSCLRVDLQSSLDLAEACLRFSGAGTDSSQFAGGENG